MPNSAPITDTHLWLRAELRPNEDRVGLTPDGAKALIDQGFRITVEESRQRVIPIEAYQAVGCETAAEGSWPDAPTDAIIFGLKELPTSDAPIRHRHIMFGHAYKGQADGRQLLDRFKAGGGTLYDLEYLTDETGRRVAAFGYWAGFAGAAVSALAWAAQQAGKPCPSMHTHASADDLVATVQTALADAGPKAIIIGALGRVGTGATDLCNRVGIAVTKWDMAETAHGGPFPEILQHDIFLNCILAGPNTPVFVQPDATTETRALSVIGDIACDPSSAFNPIKVYDRTTTWDDPVFRSCDDPLLDVTAIDNLPSMLPLESSEDYASQLLPHLSTLTDTGSGVWARAKAVFDEHV